MAKDKYDNLIIEIEKVNPFPEMDQPLFVLILHNSMKDYLPSDDSFSFKHFYLYDKECQDIFFS